MYSAEREDKMTKKFLAVLAMLLFAIVIALSTYLYTMTHLSIETDGNGDSAFVECAGQVWFYGINGHEIG